MLARHAKKLPSGKKGLLLMDGHSSHIDPKVLESIKKLNYDAVFFPSNCTGRLQPLDIGVNKVFKNYYTTKWENWLQDIAQNNTLNAKKNFTPPTKELCISWIWKAYKEITEENIQNSWNIYRNKDKNIPIRKFIIS